MKNELQKEFKGRDDVDVLVPETTSGLKSFDGIEICALRVLDELESYLDKRRKLRKRVTRISITGYSMGGLIGRYLVGILNQRKFFDEVEPVCFTTFATPHVGSYFHAKSLRAKLLNAFGSNILGASGSDLFATSTVLEDMADPESTYITGLQKFKYLTLFANAVNDRTVPFYTAYISDKDPFQNLENIDLYYYDAPDHDPSDIDSGPTKPFFVDMSKSVYVGEPSHKRKECVNAEQLRFRLLISFTLPILFPILLTVSSITTLVSYYRVREAKRLLALESHTQRLLTYTSSHDTSNPREDEHLSPSEEVAQLSGDMINDILETSEDATGDDALADVHRSGIPAKPALNDGYEGLINSIPTELELSDKVRNMVNKLNKLPWEKYTVKLYRMHSHAEIVNRRDKPGQGEEVIKYWVKTMAKRAAPTRASASTGQSTTSLIDTSS